MAQLIVPDVCRFTIEGAYGPRPWNIIVDMSIRPVGVDTREESIRDQAEIIWNQTYTDMRGAFVTEWSVNRVSWVDLDSPDGAVGFLTGTSAHPAAYSGTATGQGVAPNTAVLVQKLISTGRGRRNGRMYWSGIEEAVTQEANPGQLLTTFRTSFQAAIDTWMGNVNQEAGVEDPSYDSDMVVVHVLTRDAAGHPLTGDSRTVIDLSTQLTLATQRRRLRK